MDLILNVSREALRQCWKGRGKGWSEALCFDGCVCDRPHLVVLCHNCGFNCIGRLRIHCRVHQNVNFLMEIDRCPKCKAQQYMMSEVRVDDLVRTPGTFPPLLPAKSQRLQNAYLQNRDKCCNSKSRYEGDCQK